MNKRKFVLTGVKAILCLQPDLTRLARKISLSGDLARDFPGLPASEHQQLVVWLSQDHYDLMRQFPEAYNTTDTEEVSKVFEDIVDDVLACHHVANTPHCGLKFY